MSSWHKALKEVEKNAEHYKALDQTNIHLDENDPDLPWHEITRIEASGSYQLNSPCGFRCVVERNGLKLMWSIDFETRGSNGYPTSMFDRERLREIARKLTPGGRYLLASFLEAEVLPGVEKTTLEWRGYLNRQIDSEDCLRGLISFAHQQ